MPPLSSSLPERGERKERTVIPSQGPSPLAHSTTPPPFPSLPPSSPRFSPSHPTNSPALHAPRSPPFPSPPRPAATRPRTPHLLPSPHAAAYLRAGPGGGGGVGRSDGGSHSRRRRERRGVPADGLIGGGGEFPEAVAVTVPAAAAAMYFAKLDDSPMFRTQVRAAPS